jgi:hypothetical protein
LASPGWAWATHGDVGAKYGFAGKYSYMLWSAHRGRVQGPPGQSRSIFLRKGYSSNDWDVYGVYTDSNIGMGTTTRISWVKVPTYLVINVVAGASRHESASSPPGLAWAIGT